MRRGTGRRGRRRRRREGDGGKEMEEEEGEEGKEKEDGKEREDRKEREGGKERGGGGGGRRRERRRGRIRRRRVREWSEKRTDVERREKGVCKMKSVQLGLQVLLQNNLRLNTCNSYNYVYLYSLCMYTHILNIGTFSSVADCHNMNG